MSSGVFGSIRPAIIDISRDVDIMYAGTKSQWYSIRREQGWAGVSEYGCIKNIYCTDATISK
jgi:hypothetical protein